MTRLVLFTGKGGVGKSSTSKAATAQYWASQGYRTILVSSDPAHSTEDVLGVPVGFKPTLIAENFWAANINASTEAEEFFGELQNLMQDSFAKLMPGIDGDMFTDWFNFPGMDEVFALKKILNLTVGSNSTSLFLILLRRTHFESPYLSRSHRRIHLAYFAYESQDYELERFYDASN